MAAPKDESQRCEHEEKMDGESSEALADEARRRKSRVAGTAFLTGIAGISLTTGFGYALGVAKKKDPTMFAEGFIGSRAIPESGGALAMRALGYGTLWAAGGVGLICFGIWKLSGAKTMDEFSAKVQNRMPPLPRSKEQGRNDFKSVRELVNYLVEEDERQKSSKGS